MRLYNLLHEREAQPRAAVFLAARTVDPVEWLRDAGDLFLRNPRAARIFNVAMGVALAASVALILI